MWACSVVEQPLMVHPLMDQPLMEQPLLEQPLMEQRLMEHPSMDQPLMNPKLEHFHLQHEHQVYEQRILIQQQTQPSPPRYYEPSEPPAHIQRLQVERTTERRLHVEKTQHHVERKVGQQMLHPQHSFKPQLEQAPQPKLAPRPEAVTCAYTPQLSDHTPGAPVRKSLEPDPTSLESNRKSTAETNSDWPSEAAEAVSTTVNRALVKLTSLESNRKSTAETNSDWPSEAAEAVSTTVNRALVKLKALATHMAKTASEPIPEAVNTSAESSSSSNDHDPSPGLDMKELEAELRGTKSDEAESHAEEAAEEQSTAKRQHRRDDNGSTVSLDTLGAPKQAPLAQDSAPPRNLQRPVPLPPGATPSRNSIKNQDKIGFPSRKPPPPPAKSISSSVARAVTPIMRMRSHGGEQEAAAVGAVLEVKRTLSDKDYKAIKQKKWKQKMKIATKQRDAEISKLNQDFGDKQVAGGKYRRHKKSQSSKSQKARIDDSSFSKCGRHFRLPTAVPTCRMLETFMRTPCAQLSDAFFEDDDDISRGSIGDSEHDTDDDEFASDSESSVGRTRASVATSTATSATNTAKNFVTNVTDETATSKSKLNEKSNIGIHDKQFIRDFIANATKKGILLMLHKVVREKAFTRPINSIAFIQLGALGETGRFTGPKLVWKAVDGSEMGEVDLFDIKSLEKATALQLENYVLAMPGRSLFLRMNKGTDYVFEAPNEDEALRFIHGMRWVIARLSFNLIIGNVSVSCELLDVERTDNDDDYYGKFPSTVEEEAHWTTATNDVTSHLVDKAAITLL